MNSDKKGVLRTFSIISSTQLASNILSMVRNKILALALGPGGVGLLHSYHATIDLASQLFSTGLNSAIVKEIAASNPSELTYEKTVRSLTAIKFATIFNAIIGTLIFAIFSEELSNLIFSDNSRTSEFRIISIAVGLTIVFRAIYSILEGLREVRIYSVLSLTSTLITTCLVAFWVISITENVILLIVLTGPVVSFLAVLFIGRRIGILSFVKVRYQELISTLKNIYSLGYVFFLAGVSTLLADYALRILIINYYGLKEIGGFFAALGIASMYSNFILGAIVKDYFPKLVGMNSKKQDPSFAINEQVKLSTLFLMPGFLLTIVLRNEIIGLLYSTDFLFISNLIIPIVVANLLKSISWPLSYQLVASDLKWKFLIIELTSNVSLIVCVIIGLQYIGLDWIGIGMIFQFAVYLLLLLIINRKAFKFRLESSNIHLVIYASISLLLITFIEFLTSELVGFWINLMVIVLWIRISIKKLSDQYFDGGLTIQRVLKTINRGR